jgi:hypothetical protein
MERPDVELKLCGSLLPFVLAIAMTAASVSCYDDTLAVQPCESATAVECIANTEVANKSAEDVCSALGFYMEMYPGAFFRPPLPKNRSPSPAFDVDHSRI